MGYLDGVRKLVDQATSGSQSTRFLWFLLQFLLQAPVHTFPVAPASAPAPGSSLELWSQLPMMRHCKVEVNPCLPKLLLIVVFITAIKSKLDTMLSTCGDQRTTSWSWFPPFTCTWVLGIKLRLSGLVASPCNC